LVNSPLGNALGSIMSRHRSGEAWFRRSAVDTGYLFSVVVIASASGTMLFKQAVAVLKQLLQRFVPDAITVFLPILFLP
jgi:hypothetical protein